MILRFIKKKDYINNNNKIKNNDNLPLCLDENKIKQNAYFYGFNINNRERHYLYIFNYISNLIILRDTKAQKTINIFKLNEPVYSFTFL